MRVLITGCQGQVGRELMRLAEHYHFQATGTDYKTLNITDNVAVQTYISQHKPNIVVNAAAYTAVDKAEEEKTAAFAINALAVGYLAKACAKQDIPLVHISTDYVFNGEKKSAYLENDTVSPLGVYGESKFAGEAAVYTGCLKYYVLRTSWVFSSHGNNFVKTMLRLGKERKELGVVADQFGKPTSAQEIARIIYELLNSQKNAWGTYHLAQPDATSWYGFAQRIFKEAKKQGMNLSLETLNALDTVDYPTPAKRPQNSALNCTKLEQTFGLVIQSWQESLAEVIEELNDV